MSSWRGRRRGGHDSSPGNHSQQQTNNHSASPSPPTPQRQQQVQLPQQQPAASEAAASSDEEAGSAGNKSILNEVLAFMHHGHTPDSAQQRQLQGPPQPQQLPQPQLPQSAYSAPPPPLPTPSRTLLPVFQPPHSMHPLQPMQPPPGFSRPPPPFSSPPHMQPVGASSPPSFHPSRPAQSPSAAVAFGAFSAPPPARPFPAPIAPPPGFGGMRMGGGGMAGSGYGGLYSHFAPPAQSVQPLPHPHSPYAPPVHAPSMSPPSRGIPEQSAMQQQQQWTESGSRVNGGGAQVDAEAVAAMQRLHLNDGVTAQPQQAYKHGPPHQTSPAPTRPHASAPFDDQASLMRDPPNHQQPSAFLFQTPQRQLHSPATNQQSPPANAHPTRTPPTGNVWSRKSSSPVIGASPDASGQPQRFNSRTGAGQSPQASVNGSPAPSTPSASTFVPYVPHPSALTQPIKPHLRRGFPSLAHMPHSSHIDQQLNVLLSTLIPSSSSDQSRDACRAQLEALVRRVWPTASVRLFGSSVNLLCDEHSDCDLSLLMGVETGVKQSCYNSFIPKPKKEKAKRSKDKDGGENNGNAAATGAESEHHSEETLGTAQGADEADAPQQGQPVTADDASAPKPPSSPQPNSKQSSSLTVDALPTLFLSNPAHLQLLALTRESEEQPLIEPGAVIEKLAAILKTESERLYSGILALPKARVPIVKFHSSQYGYEADCGINNLLAIENSQLIRAYMTADVRARQLVFIIKHWAKQRKINDPFRGTLSSYAYVLMTIHYLQQLSPPVLPCLQSYQLRGRGERMVSGYDCWWDERLAAEWRSDNSSSLSALLSGWYLYYAHCFGFTDDVISVRVGGVLGKREKEKEWAGSGKRDKHLLSIEDPFEVSHDLGRVCDGNALFEIRGECIRGSKMQAEGKSVQALMAKYEKEWRGS